MKRELKVYVMWNLDGTNSVAVAATTLKDAAAKIGTSTYHMRQMGYQIRDDFLEVWADPAHVYVKPIDDRSGSRFVRWREARA